MNPHASLDWQLNILRAQIERIYALLEPCADHTASETQSLHRLLLAYLREYRMALRDRSAGGEGMDNGRADSGPQSESRSGAAAETAAPPAETDAAVSEKPLPELTFDLFNGIQSEPAASSRPGFFVPEGRFLRAKAGLGSASIRNHPHSKYRIEMNCKKATMKQRGSAKRERPG